MKGATLTSIELELDSLGIKAQLREEQAQHCSDPCVRLQHCKMFGCSKGILQAHGLQ